MYAPRENFLAQDAPPCSSKILLGTVLVLLAASRAHSPGPFVTPFVLVLAGLYAHAEVFQPFYAGTRDCSTGCLLLERFSQKNLNSFALVSRKILAGSLVAFILASMLSGRELVLAGGQGHLVVEDVSVLLGVSAVATALGFAVRWAAAKGPEGTHLESELWLAAAVTGVCTVALHATADFLRGVAFEATEVVAAAAKHKLLAQAAQG